VAGDEVVALGAAIVGQFLGRLDERKLGLPIGASSHVNSGRVVVS